MKNNTTNTVILKNPNTTYDRIKNKIINNCVDFFMLFILPVFQLLQGAIIVVPITCTAVMGATVTALVWFVPETLLTFWTIWKTPRWGPNMKILVTLVAILAVVMWLPFVFVCSLIAGFFYGLLGPMIHGFILLCGSTNDYCDTCCLGPIPKVFKYTCNCIVDFWHMDRSYKLMLHDFRTSANTNSSVYEISFLNMIVGFFIVIIGGTINTVLFLLMNILLYIPFTFRIWIDFFKLVCCCGDRRGYDIDFCKIIAGICFVPIFVFSLFVPLVGILAMVVAPFYAFWGSIESALYACNKNKYYLSIPYNFEYVSWAWYKLMTYIFDGEYNFPTPHLDGTYLPVGNSNRIVPINNDQHVIDIREQVVEPYQSINQVNSHNPISISEVWKNYFAMCTKYIRDAITEGLITKDDIESCAPYLFLDIPSYVIFKAIVRSLKKYNNTITFEMADGTVITEKNRPQDILGLGNKVWPIMVSLRNDTKKLKLTDDEIKFMEKYIIVKNNIDAKMIKLPANCTTARITEFHILASKYESFGTTLSIMPTSHRNFGDAMINALH